MLYFFWGENDFLALEEIKKMKEAFLKKNSLANSGSFDLEEDGEAEKFLENISSGGGFFSSDFLAVAKNFSSLTTTQEKGIISALKKISRKSQVIFFHKGEKFPAKKIYVFLKKEAQIKKFSLLAPAELEGWTKKELEDRSQGELFFEQSALKNFLFLVENNQWRVDRELDKLIAFVEKGQITQEVLSIFLEKREVNQAFDLVDSLGTKDKKRAMKILLNMLKNKQDGFLIWGSVISLFRNLAKVHSLAAKGCSPGSPEVSQLKMHPFVVEKTFSQLRKFSSSEIKRFYRSALDLDQRVKLGELKIEEALIEIVARN